MSTVFHKLRSVLEKNAVVGQEVLSHEVKAWYQRAYGKSDKFSLGPYSRKEGDPPDPRKLLINLKRVPNSKSYRYRLTEAINDDSPEIERMSHYEIVKAGLKDRQGEVLSSSEIEAELRKYFKKKLPEERIDESLPEGLKNLGLFAANSKLKNCKNGNHLLETTPVHGHYFVCTQNKELSMLPSDPKLELFSGEPDAFQQAFMKLWHDQPAIGSEGGYLDWLQASEKKKLFNEHKLSKQQVAAFEHLLKDSPQVPVLKVIQLICQASSLDQLYQDLKASSLQSTSYEAKASDWDYAWDSITRGIELKQRSHSPLLSSLSHDFMQKWSLYEALYYRRLHYKRRPRERVLNEEVPKALAKYGVAALAPIVFLENVLEWFLGGGKYKRQPVSSSADDDWYAAGYKARTAFLEKGARENLSGELKAIWKLRTGLEKPETFESTLDQMLDIIYHLPGFEDDKNLHYPAIYLATGLLSLLFPEHIFTVSDQSLRGLKTLQAQGERLPDVFEKIKLITLPKDLRKPTFEEVCQVLYTIRFEVVTAINQSSNAEQQLTPRKLDMLLYTLRGHQVQDLEQMRNQPASKSKREEASLSTLAKAIFKEVYRRDLLK